MSQNKNTDAMSVRRVVSIAATPAAPFNPGIDIIKVAGQIAGVTIPLPDPADLTVALRPQGSHKYEIQCGAETEAFPVIITAPAPSLINGGSQIALIGNFSHATIFFDSTSGNYFASMTEGSGAPTAQSRAFANAFSTVPLTPFAQAPIATDTNVMMAGCVVGGSGVYDFAFTLDIDATAADVVTVKVKVVDAGTGVVAYGNRTACGQNCYFQTGTGGITIAGIATGGANVYYSRALTIPAAPLRWSFGTYVELSNANNSGFTAGHLMWGCVIAGNGAAGNIAGANGLTGSLYMAEKAA